MERTLSSLQKKGRAILVTLTTSLIALSIATNYLISRFQDNVNEYTHRTQLVQNSNKRLNQSRLDLTQLLFAESRNKDSEKISMSTIETNAKAAKMSLHSFYDLSYDEPRFRYQLKHFDVQLYAWEKEVSEIIDLIEQGNSAQAAFIFSTSNAERFSIIQAEYRTLEQQLDYYANQEEARLNTITSWLKLGIVTLAFASLFIGTLFIWCSPERLHSIAVQISQNLNNSFHNKTFTRRSLESNDDKTLKNELLNEDLKAFAIQLSSLVREVRSGTEFIQHERKSKDTLSYNKNHLNERQTFALDLLIDAVREMAYAVREISCKIDRANRQPYKYHLDCVFNERSASELCKLASQIDNAYAAITTMSDKSEQTVPVFDTILSIVEQTNALALNAIVEAIRMTKQENDPAAILSQQDPYTAADIQRTMNVLSQNLRIAADSND